MSHLNFLFAVKEKGGAKGLWRDPNIDHLSELLREVPLPSEYGRVFDRLHPKMQAVELRQVNQWLFPVLINWVRGKPPEPSYLRKMLLATLSFLARVALLPSPEFNDVDKGKCTYALSRWREAFVRCIGEAYIGVNDVRRFKSQP